jgi:hypothetical protein
VGGSTLVPLRFVAEALGAYVQWHGASSTVEVRTQEAHLATLPQTPAGEVTGQVTGVYTNTNPMTLTVRVNGQDTSVPVNGQTIFLRSVSGQPATQVGITDIKPGDQVTVRRDGGGTAVSVTASYGEVRGTVKSIGKLANGDNVITLNDGTTVELVRDAPVTMGGRRIAISDVMPDETVVISTNPGNSLGFGVAVVTGGNPAPTPPGTVGNNATGGGTLGSGSSNAAVTVDSFTHDANRPLKTGDVLTATLRGTPGGRASFAIPGVVDEVAMRETSPGVYTGSYTVPKNVSMTGAAVLGRLTANGATAPLIQASGQVIVDSRPPKVGDLSPGRNASVDSAQPLIYATLSDEGGSGIDPSNFHMTLDSTDISSQATVTPSFFNVKPSATLAPGAHQVHLTVGDHAGNVATRNWTFTVAGSSPIKEFRTTLPAGTTVGADQTLEYYLTAQPGGKASFSIAGIAENVSMRETSPGVYYGTYTIRGGDNAQNAPVTATFTASNGTASTTQLPNPVTISTAAPLARITSPEDNSTVGSPLTVRGTAAPHATVRVKVNYVSKALGGILAVNGTAATTEVTADANGNWTAEGIVLNTNSLLAKDRDTVFTISAASVGANGDEAQASTVEVRRGSQSARLRLHLRKSVFTSRCF